jgi:purine-binding chemotaxis protein CheW
VNGEKVLLTCLGEERYAIPIAWVEEVLPALPIEPVPQCPRFVRGVVFIRGHLIPVLDAAERLGQQNHQRPAESNIVCLRHGERLIGVEFDEALDLVDLDTEKGLTAFEIGARAGFFTGVVEHDGRLVRLLDPEKLVSCAEAAEWLPAPAP